MERIVREIPNDVPPELVVGSIDELIERLEKAEQSIKYGNSMSYEEFRGRIG